MECALRGLCTLCLPEQVHSDRAPNPVSLQVLGWRSEMGIRTQATELGNLVELDVSEG
jgi:hypothetical protein